MDNNTAIPATWYTFLKNALQNRTKTLLALGVGFQLLVLVGMILLHALPLLVGQTIFLRVQPIDPRDMFRGDYVILSYEISRVTVNAPDMSDDSPVFVQLAPDEDGKHWHAVSASQTRPKSGTYIRGKYAAGRLMFGIEAYYLEEGTGHDYEQAIRDRRLSAEVALTSWGQATLKGLHIEPMAPRR